MEIWQYSKMDTKEHRDWLLKLMADHGMNEKQWAEEAEISTPNILYNYFSGRAKSISPESCEKLAPFIGLTGSQMRSKKDLALVKRPMDTPVQKMTDGGGSEPLCPVYGALGASSDAAVYFTDNNIVDRIKMPRELENVKDPLVMIVKGSSMEPRYSDGDLVSVNKYKTPQVGRDVVIVLEEDGRAIVKCWLGETKTEVRLKQHNPAHGEKHEFTIKKSLIRDIYFVAGRPSP